MAENEEFKQFSYLIDNVYEPKYKNRFVLDIPTIPLISEDGTIKEDGSAKTQSGLMIGLAKAKRPSYSVDVKEIPKFNEKSFYAGTPAHDNKMSCEFWDYISGQGNLTNAAMKSSAEILYKWYNTVYNLKLGSQGFKAEYSTTAHLFLLDPNGAEVEHWKYINF